MGISLLQGKKRRIYQLRYKDLIRETAALGFESVVEEEDAMLFAARRALMTLYTDRAVFSTARFRKRAFPNVPVRNIEHMGGTTVSVSFSARAMSFKSYGIGECIIYDGSGERRIRLVGECEVRRFLFGDGHVEFTGVYAYSICDLAFFPEITSAHEEDIPLHRGYAEYDMSALTNDFLSFVGMPYAPSSEEIRGSRLIGHIARLPESYGGDVLIDYRVAPIMPTGDPEEEIYTPPGSSQLLPLLTAAYVWLDDDAEKSQYYMSLYRDGMAALNVYSRASVSGAYKNVTGWA